MRLTPEQRRKAITEAMHIDASPHEWPKEDMIPLLCHALLDEVELSDRLTGEIYYLSGVIDENTTH